MLIYVQCVPPANPLCMKMLPCTNLNKYLSIEVVNIQVSPYFLVSQITPFTLYNHPVGWCLALLDHIHCTTLIESSSDMDTQAQNFWIESINKETALRFQWRLRYSKQFSAATFQSRKKDKGMKLGNELSQRLSLLEKNQNDSILKQLSPVQSEKLVKVDLTLPDMRPPSANTRALLYTGISAHGEGRRAYLARRKNLRPDEKYDFPMMTSSNYGWKVLEYSDLKKSPHARTGIIRDSFYRPSGVMITAGVHD